ncbi:MAG TPA: hypothetical protein VN956_21205, partial [Pyrinomonadaceae bacterium]|nr:hypothetical protein [Pyrinomonadaceae bacterium]
MEMRPIAFLGLRIAKADDHWYWVVGEIIEVFGVATVNVIPFVLLFKKRLSALNLHRDHLTRDSSVRCYDFNLSINTKVMLLVISP